MSIKRILVLGATGMLGHTLIHNLDKREGLEIFATTRSMEKLDLRFEPDLLAKIFGNVDASDLASVTAVFEKAKPDVVINCIGVIKQSLLAKDPIVSISINALFPHKLASLCSSHGARLIHFSTDCVFSGEKGMYKEDGFPDCNDLYGRTKLLGEVDYPHAITLRTSMIGHELQSAHALVDWFLSQKDKCKGYTRAIFSGVPTVVLAQIIRDVVIPHPELSGVYHVAAKPINKFDLLKMIADVYGKTIEIIPDEKLMIDRSLDAGRFLAATGYTAPGWPEMIKLMHSYK